MACITLYDVPDLHCFIITPASQQISIGVKIDTEDVVCMACKGLDTDSLSMEELRGAQLDISGCSHSLDIPNLHGIVVASSS